LIFLISSRGKAKGAHNEKNCESFNLFAEILARERIEMSEKISWLHGYWSLFLPDL